MHTRVDEIGRGWGMAGRRRWIGAFAAVALTLPLVRPASATPPVARWPQFQGGPRHLGFNPLEHDVDVSNVADLTLSWVGLVPGDLDWASPVAGRGNVYITADDAGLAVFRAGGCGRPACGPSWRGRTGPQAIAAPAVAGDRVYVSSQASFTSNDGRLNVFGADGCGAAVCDPLWQGLGGSESFLVSSPAVAGDRVFVGSYDGNLYAFDGNGCGAATCQPLWVGLAGGTIDSSPAVAAGMVYAGSTDGNLYAFDADGCGAATCQPLWHGATGGSIDIASPTAAGGVVLVSSGDFLDAFKADGCGAAECAPLWRGIAPLMSNTPAVANGIVYVDAQPLLQGGRALGVVEAFGLGGCGSRTCDPLWVGSNHTSGSESSPVVANGVVYVGKGPATSVDAGVFAFDASGCGKGICEPLAFMQTGPRQFYLSSTPAVVNGRVYMGSAQTSGQSGLYVFERP